MFKSIGKTIYLIAITAICSFHSFSEEQKKIRVGYFSDNIFHFGQSDIEFKKGYGYEYYAMLAKYTGWNYEYCYGSWTEILDEFLKGNIDIIDDVSITPERKQQMLFSSLPMGEEHYYIFVPQGNTQISMSDINTLNGKKIGANKNSLNQTLLENFIEENELDCAIVLCNGVNDRLQKIQSGEIDAMVTTDGFTMEDFRPTYLIGNSPFYFAVQKDRTDLLKQLNTAMKHNHEINPNFNNQLRDKYFKKSILRTTLSRDELNYLKNHPVIKIGYRKKSMPFCGTKTSTGELTGLLSDIIEQVEKSLKVKFEKTAYGSNNEMIADLKEGRIDCAYPVMDDVWLSEQLGYTQTTNVTSERMILIYKGKYKGVDSYQKFGYTIGSPSQHVYAIEHNMGTERIGFATEEDTIQAIRKGTIDFMVMNIVSWNYWTKVHNGCEGLSYVVLEDDVGYSFAVAKANTNLYSIIESAIRKIDSSVISDSLNRHSQTKYDYSIRNFIRYNFIAFLILIFSIFMIVIFMIIIYERNRAHKEMLTFKAEHDALTGVYNRSILQKIDRKHESNICLAIIDIDDFKSINDQYGHEMGDSIIKKVAQHLTSIARNTDRVIRFGGDEFLVIFNGMDRFQSSILMAKFQKVQRFLNEASKNTVESSVSVGIAFSEKGYTKELFDLADEALYKSKSAGKHTITINDFVVKK